MGIFSKKLGIDLGTANTRIYKDGTGIILTEPTVAAIDKNNGKLIAVGKEADEMIGRTPDNIVAVKPIRDGVIAEFDIARAMLKYFIDESGAKGIMKPKVYVAVPSGITEVEKRAVEEAAINAGAKAVAFVSEPMAAALGANLEVDDATGNMIVDIGGGTTEVAVISLGGVVSSRSLRIAGDAFDSAIINYLKKELSISIGDKMAEEVKIAIGSACDTGINKTYRVRGRDVSSGLPKQIEVNENQIREALRENLAQIIDAIKITLEHTPPELASDVMEKGITVSGGSADLKGICRYIKEEIGINARIAENPHDAVIKGTGMSVDRVDFE